MSFADKKKDQDYSDGLSKIRAIKEAIKESAARAQAKSIGEKAKSLQITCELSDGSTGSVRFPSFLDKWVNFCPELKCKLIAHREEEESVLLCQADEAVRLPRHRHREQEWISVISGMLVDHETGDEFTPGRGGHWGRNEWHDIEVVIPSLYIVWFRPAFGDSPLESV